MQRLSYTIITVPIRLAAASAKVGLRVGDTPSWRRAVDALSAAIVEGQHGGQRAEPAEQLALPFGGPKGAWPPSI